MPDSCVQLLVGDPHVDSATISRNKHLLPIKLASPVVFSMLASGNVTVPGPRAPKIVKSSHLLSFLHTPHLIYLQILHVLSSIYTQNLPPSPTPASTALVWANTPSHPDQWSSTRRVLCTCSSAGDFDRVWTHFSLSQLESGKGRSCDLVVSAQDSSP